MLAAWLVSAFFCCGLFLAGTWFVAKRVESRPEAETCGALMLPLLLGGSVVVRVILAATTTGHTIDIGTFSAWSAHAAEGLTSFYSPGYFADYPPGYIYVLWVVGKLRLLLSLDFNTPAFMVLLKLPAILADTVTIWILERLARRQWSGKSACAIAALYAFNPAVLLDSAVWGQVDSVLVLFVTAGILLLLDNRAAGAAVCCTAALLIKPQALIFAPLPALWFVSRLMQREQNTVSDILIFSGTAIVSFCLMILPFSLNASPDWILSKYGSTLASYPYASFNAFNLFALTGGNLVSTAEKFLFGAYAVWGNIFIVMIVACTTAVTLRSREPARFWYSALFLAASVFVLSVKMHERYLFPALLLSLTFFSVSRERWALLLFAGFSVTQFLNAAEVLALSYRKIYAVPRFDPLLLSVSLVNVLLWLLLAWGGYRSFIRRQLVGESGPCPLKSDLETIS